ncbi:hypothetical protein ALC62_05734 [Cyphomyrmex costatus]|uniref:Mutator-like transposase domain-containing protein n=1 Tax=Cyphomyrmex costatus TaxID=456900 RepID=A0A151IJH9_9HYME|nr:hypothetical protein ALC62_05734 [Cyphomyrmex costatus]
MTIPTFVDLQGFIVGKKFVAKEVAVLREGTILSHYIFTCPIPWNYLTKSEKHCASWLGAYHHGLQCEDGMIPYSMTKRLITMAVIGAEWNWLQPSRPFTDSERRKVILLQDNARSLIAKNILETIYNLGWDILPHAEYDPDLCIINKSKLNETEFDTWFSEHGINCLGMEVQSMLEMFARAENLHGAQYKKYIGDGDTKTFAALLKHDDEVEKKECVNHVQKRIGSKLRKAKKTNKNIGGRGAGKLTDKLINELGTYYGLAIRRNSNDLEKMVDDVWTIFYHKISTNEKPMHERCPSGPNSWCKWRRAEAIGTLESYEHPPPLDSTVQKVIKPIYEDLSKEDLLKRCLGGFTQNNNEAFNKTIWQFMPKHSFCSKNIIEIAALTATCIFNEGFKPVLKIMEIMGITIGPNADFFACERNETRIQQAQQLMTYEVIERKMVRCNEMLETLQNFEEMEGILYGPGIAD